ncbi:zinc finger domain-containing protein [Streptomyces collinus]
MPDTSRESVLEELTREQVRDVSCPACDAPPGTCCTPSDRHPHQSRVEWFSRKTGSFTPTASRAPSSPSGWRPRSGPGTATCEHDDNDKHADPALTAHPAGTPDDLLPAGDVLDKDHCRLVFRWPGT